MNRFFCSTCLSLRHLLFVLSCLLIAACGGGNDGTKPPMFATKASLGEALFSDVNLSLNRTQSCASCHDPLRGFIDSRVNSDGETSPVSLGNNAVSFGDRNAPTASYAALTPEFQFESHPRFNSQQGDYEGFVGGLFLDGRADTLQMQAEGPPLNPIEMGMPNKEVVVERIRESEDYEASFKYLFGNQIFDAVDDAYSAMSESIAAFEQTEIFMPFDSRYDLSLRGEFSYDPLSKAALGKSLFFSQQFTNCATCHQLKVNGDAAETFSTYEYHNIGVPVNTAARVLNNSQESAVDIGLGIFDAEQRGKFKVPTLRNVAVTAPYMHNGVFKELATVIKFYDHYLTGSNYMLNPETGVAWNAPEIEDTISAQALNDGTPLSDAEVEALECFLLTLTDAQFEYLILSELEDCISF